MANDNSGVENAYHWWPLQYNEWKKCAMESVCKCLLFTVIGAAKLMYNKLKLYIRWLYQQFKLNYTQVMEAMARKEAGESPNKRPAQSQAQVRWFTVIVQVSIYHFFLSDPCFAGFPRQPGQKIQMQLKYSHPASKLDQQQLYPLSKVTYFGKSGPWSTV